MNCFFDRIISAPSIKTVVKSAFIVLQRKRAVTEFFHSATALTILCHKLFTYITLLFKSLEILDNLIAVLVVILCFIGICLIN